MALLDALALARALEAQSNLDTALWRICAPAALAYPPLSARLLAVHAGYQSDSAAIAWLRDWLMSPLSRIPPAPAVLAALVAGIGARRWEQFEGETPPLPAPGIDARRDALHFRPWLRTPRTTAVFRPSPHERVRLIDFGSQVTQLIARRVRESGVYCEIHPYNKVDAAS